MNVAADVPPIILPWHDLAATIKEIATKVRADGSPDVVVGILRGGMVPATVFGPGCEEPREPIARALRATAKDFVSRPDV